MSAVIPRILTPIMEHPSRLDASKIITRSNCAITLIKVKGVVKSHAEIIIEEVNARGEYSAKMAHLSGESGSSPCCFGTFGSVSMSDFTDKTNIRYGFKSDTSIVTRENGNTLLSNINKDIQNNEHNPVPFHILGSRSVFVRKKKCYETSSEELLEFKKTNPSAFLELCKKFEADRTIEGSNDQERQILALMREHLNIVYRDRHSCITWAQEKLSAIGLEIGRSKPFDSIITVTAFHVR